MAYTAWAANTSYTVGTVRRATAQPGTGLVFRVTVAGTSGATQPSWPTKIGGTIVDGGVTWIAVSATTQELQGIAPSAIIELFELKLDPVLHGENTSYRFHAGVSRNASGEVTWAGNAYTRMPIEADGFEWNGTGQLPRPKLRVANLLGTITALLLTLPRGLDGAQVTRIRTLARYLDAVNFEGGVSPFSPDPQAEMPREIYYIDRKVTENRDVIEFELAASFDLQGVRGPKRQVIQNICQWKYRRYDADTSAFDYTHVDCPYTSNQYFTIDDVATNDPALDACSKSLASCELRFGAVTATATAAVGSNVLTSLANTNTNRIGIGDLITGFGVPTSATVTAKSSTTLTLSANATGSTVVSGTGTMASTGITITMVSVTGILPGMTVTGTYVPANTTVASVNATTKVVTLSISDNILLRGSLTTKSATRDTSTRFLITNTSGIALNDYVSGNGIYLRTRVSSISTNVSVTLSKFTAVPNGSTLTLSFYVPIVPTAQTYTFTANNTYVIRPVNGLPFGSFPGVSSYR